jgi:hypothetical protein
MARAVPMTPVLPPLGALATTLKRYATELPSDALPALVGELEATKALVWARLVATERAAHEQQPAARSSALLDAKAMAERLQVPESWLREHARHGGIPCVYVGRYVRFDPAAVLRAVSNHKPT